MDWKKSKAWPDEFGPQVDEENDALPSLVAPQPKPAIPETMLQKLEATQPDLVAKYREKMSGANQGIKDAQDNQDIGNYGNIAGKLANDFANSQKKDTVYANSFSKLGSAPQIEQASRPEYDGSMIDKIGAQGVSRAKEAKTDAEAGFWNDEKLKDTTQARADQAIARTRNDKQFDSGNDLAKRTQLLAKSALVAKAREASAAGDKAGAAQLKAIDVSGMSASEAKDFYDAIKGTDYKDVLNNQSADKRAQMQINAEKEKGVKSDRDTTLKLSERYNQDPTTKATAEVRNSLAKAEKLVKNPTPLNDMALVYNFMKANDPGSTVREGEFAMAAKSGSLGDQARAYVLMAETGKMTDAKRREMLSAMKQQATAQEQQQAQVDGYYSDLSSQYKADPELVVGKKRSTFQQPEKKLPHGSDLP